MPPLATSTRPLASGTALRPVLVLLLAAGGLALSFSGGDGLTALVLATIADAYIQVTGFVAATLFIFYGLEKIAGIDAEKLINNARPNTQVAVAAFLGALPGCGGAIIVVSQYATGRLSFGAVLATLTATMGDAAFLLIAREPITGFAMIAVGCITGVVTGVLVNAIHSPDFLRPEKRTASGDISVHNNDSEGGVLDRFWVALIIPGIIMGILSAFQFDIDAAFGTDFWPEPSIGIGAMGGILCVSMFLLPKILGRIPATGEGSEITRKVIGDTNFVTAWVVLAFLAFELSVHAFSIDLAAAFRGYAVFAPLVATLIGFIPGCGPQLVVTTLYLAGAIPLSAQIGNAISNDGDALFPAIAIAPGAAIIATLYSAIPALVLGYGWMVLVGT